MTRGVRTALTAVVLVGFCGAVAPVMARRQDAPSAAQKNEQISLADVEAMFDTMAVMEAERFIELTPEQFPQFVQRMKRLQEARTVHVRKHNRALAELRAMANPQTGKADEATIEGKLKEMDAIEADSQATIAKALDGVNQLLSAKQRARFRLLEDNMEKKKLDFLIKVRQQGGRGGRGGQ